MKTTLLKTLLAIGTLASANSVSALTMYDMNYRDTDLLQIEMNESAPSASGVFDLVGNDGDGRDLLGFDPGAMNVVGAIAGVVFASVDSQGQASLLARIAIELGSESVLVEGSPSALSGWSQSMFSLVGAQEFVFSSDSVSGSIVLEDIQADGMLDWRVRLNSQQLLSEETIVLWGVYLGVKAEQNLELDRASAPVPDVGVTAAMLGIGLFVVMGAARHRRER